MTEENSSKICGICKQCKSVSEFFNDKNRIDGKYPYCKTCRKEKDRISRQKNKEKNNAYASAYYHANKHKGRLNSESHREKKRAASRKWLENNRELQYLRNKKYKDANPSMFVAYYKMRQARKAQAMPSWADVSGIKSLYEECAKISKETGVLHHVDHFYPL